MKSDHIATYTHFPGLRHVARSKNLNKIKSDDCSIIFFLLRWKVNKEFS